VKCFTTKQETIVQLATVYLN